MTKAKFETIKEALLRNRDGESIAELRSDYPQIYKWNMAFAVVINGESGSLQGQKILSDMMKLTSTLSSG